MFKHLVFIFIAWTAFAKATPDSEITANEKTASEGSLEQTAVKDSQTPTETPELNSGVNETKSRSKSRPVKIPGTVVCSNCLWLGGGAHYLVFQQKSATNVEPINYQSVGAPSLWAQFRFKLIGRFGINGEYQSQSGAELETKSINLEKTKINWTYSTLGFDYRFKNQFRLFGRRWLPRLLLAYQKHSMPFLQKLNTNSYSVEPLAFSSLSVGGYFDILSSETWSFFLTNRLQVPIQSDSKIQVQQGLSFDGSVGAVYHMTPFFAAALFWGGQYHGLKYKTITEEASYTLWTSKVNLLLGLYF